MKKLILLITAALTLFTGCADPAAVLDVPTYTAPTLPELDQSLSPDQLLTTAVGRLQTLDSFAVSYGSGWQKDLVLTNGTGETAFANLRQLVPNEAFIEDFCAMGMVVSPSNDGSFCYQLPSLTLEQVCQLLCGRPLTEAELSTVSNYTEVVGAIRIDVDPIQIFQALEVDIALDDAHWFLQIRIHH